MAAFAPRAQYFKSAVFTNFTIPAGTAILYRYV